MNTLRARVTSLKLCRENTQVFKGCHSNGYTERYKTLHVDSPRLDLHFVSLHHRSISNSLGAMAENVIFRRFWAKNGHFWPVTIATSLPISFWLLIYLHSHGGYMIRAFWEPYIPLWPRRTSKTSIFGENHRHPQLPGPISRKRLELGQI